MASKLALDKINSDHAFLSDEEELESELREAAKLQANQLEKAKLDQVNGAKTEEEMDTDPPNGQKPGGPISTNQGDKSTQDLGKAKKPKIDQAGPSGMADNPLGLPQPGRVQIPKLPRIPDFRRKTGHIPKSKSDGLMSQNKGAPRQTLRREPKPIGQNDTAMIDSKQGKI